MSIFQVSITSLRRLESLHSRLFYGVDLRKRRLHWFGWDKLLASREEGGFNIGSLFHFNWAMLFKWSGDFFMVWM